MKHGWNSWEHYLSIHEKTLRFYNPYMTVVKTYTIFKHTTRYYEIQCQQIPMRTYKGTDVRIDIKKDILVDEVNGRLQARTVAYSYNANLPNPNGQNLIRYCSPHEDHNQFHHKHIFMPTPQVLKIEDDEYPHVGEFLNEVLETF